ncbi:hypothetical protein [Desulfosporosinus lacus]|uniref:Uncharacterized protein n=1 Tax=Desulfosporosinus lacus DSM 15449 TaxID=1121420 RepID=A0A1M5WS15_9FIRM|nr:hypothetical protein [Desulfosporosinus lacus]SHH90406.1 hypothetical protein SAMN02746098_01758 [Desulfosporosinus lacus DSM 15449]
MGTLCQYVVDKTVEGPNPPFPSARMAKLFYEFLGRYNEWKLVRRQETIGIFVVFLFGLLALIPWFYPEIGISVSILMLILLFFAVKHYIKLNEKASHLYVNVHILQHHLIGKLEVGFCDHREPCQCVEEFRGYVLKKYDISLDIGSLR